jgi:hypothetical protein
VCFAAINTQGSISFPIFMLHGALGQLFYKKIIATKVTVLSYRISATRLTQHAVRTNTCASILQRHAVAPS